MLPSDIGGIGGLFIMVAVFCVVVVPLFLIYAVIRKWWDDRKTPDPFKSVNNAWENDFEGFGFWDEENDDWEEEDDDEDEIEDEDIEDEDWDDFDET